MSSAVYFKFKASIKQYTIPFDGSAISVKDLRSAIRLSCGLKSTDFELQILDKQGKEFSKEDDLIPKFSDLIVRRLPKASDLPRKKIANPEDMTRRDPYKAINSLPKINPYSNSINLAKSNIPDDEKIDIMAKRCSEEYSEKNFLVKSKPYGIPPASYVCNKCHQGGHWIHECPGLRDKDGRLLDFKSVKRPTGIPQDFLLEVSPGTPGAYLTKEGKYMVPIKDAEAYAMGKKEKRPFSIDENPPYVPKNQDFPSKIKCSLCSRLLENPTCTPCCSSVYCEKCITDYLYDPDVNGSRKCPSCQSVIEQHTSLIEHELLRQLIQCWKANMLTKEIVDSCVTTLNHSSNKKTELLLLNEDSSKSPDMKFDSANNTGINATSDNDQQAGVVKTESEKVFVNNRRVLKPKSSQQQLRTDSPSNIIATIVEKLPDNSINVPVGSGPESGDVVKQEKLVATNSSNDLGDVNDLLFDKVKDFESWECVGEKREPTVSLDRPSGAGSSARNNCKIEIVAKRGTDGTAKNCSDRKIDTNLVNNGQAARPGLLSGLSSELSNSIQQAFTTIINNAVAGVDTRSDLLNQFPGTALLPSSSTSNHSNQNNHNHHHTNRNNNHHHHNNHHSNHSHHNHAQQQHQNQQHQQQQAAAAAAQFLTNRSLPLNALDPLQWPLINSMYNNLPLHTMFNAALHPSTNNAVAVVAAAAASNWINSNPGIANNPNGNAALNIAQVTSLAQQQLNAVSRILTKEEFYERQRRLRAEKMKVKYSSRSPSGSQSPRRKRKSHSKYRDKYSGSSTAVARQHYKTSSINSSRHSSLKRRGASKDERDSRSRRRRSNHPTESGASASSQPTPILSPLDAVTTSTDKQRIASATHKSIEDINAIDPKLMEDSINTFLKYLTVVKEEKREPTVVMEPVVATKDSEPAPLPTSTTSRHKRHRQHSSADARPASSTSTGNKSRTGTVVTGNSGSDILGKSKQVSASDENNNANVGSTRPKVPRRSTRSRSVPKVSKDRLADSQRVTKTSSSSKPSLTSNHNHVTTSSKSSKQLLPMAAVASVRVDNEREPDATSKHHHDRSLDGHKPPTDLLNNSVGSSGLGSNNVGSSSHARRRSSPDRPVTKDKKSKKSKHRNNSHDDEDAKKKRKHKKHKHKKSKKVKKEKRDD